MKDISKILVAMDGSEQAMNAVRYLGGMVSPKHTRIVLFHVALDLPEALMDMQRIPGFHRRSTEISSWRSHVKNKIDEYLSEAKSILVAGGFPTSKVTTLLQKKQLGISRDILKQSRKEYQALVVGRKGVSRIKDMLMGSTANKLVGKILHIPFIVVGGNPQPGKVILAFDGSKNAQKALNYFGMLADPAQCEVEICHVIRSINVAGPMGEINFFPADIEKTWIKESVKNIEPMMEDAKIHLIKAGFSSDRVTCRILTDQASRAFGILSEAEAGGFGSIVVGRRGLSRVQEFIMGRVGRKILHAADNHAVWVVG
jgi:nucleotide-binding universal stress UspA family protein